MAETCPAIPMLYRLEVRWDRERQEFLQQLQRLEQTLQPRQEDATSYDLPGWSQISGRLDALHSVLANHGARLLEGEAHLQALMEHLGWQAPQWPETPKVLSERHSPTSEVSQWRPEPGLTFQRQLEELQRSHQAMQEMLRESKGSFNATLGDMKALWREVARLQQGQSEGPEQPPSAVSGESAILGDVHREVQSIKLHLESHPWPSRWTPEICQMEIQQLKKQQRIMETLLLTYREALSEMTQKLKEALERPSSPKLGVSLAAHARRHASERPSSKEGAKLLAENVLQFVEELHRRVRHVEDASSAKEIAEVKRQMEVLQGETLMSFHQLQQAVMIIKNLKKYFTFEVTVLDDKEVRRRFRASNYQSTTRVKPFICTMPMRLDEGWNQIQFNLSDFTRRAYGTNYIETLRVQLHANCRIRRIYFSDRLYSEEELPPEFKLFLPVAQKAQTAAASAPPAAPAAAQ